MRRVLLIGGAAAAIMALGATGAMALPNPSFGGCQLDGTAKFKQPLTVNQPTPSVSQPNAVPWTNDVVNFDFGSHFDYSFSGALTNCQGGSSAGPSSAAPATGNIYAGQNVPVDGTTYTWPFAGPTGNGGCTGSQTSGSAVVVWADKSLSVIDYSTSGALAAVGLTGNFRDGSVTLTSVPDASGATTTRTFALRYGHDYTGGPLAFEPPDPTLCNGAGVTTAGIQGVIGHGYPQVTS